MAGRGLKGWQDAKKEAVKILGKDGKLPKPRVDIEKAMDDGNKAIEEIKKIRDSMATKMDAGQTAISKVKNAASSYDDMVQGSDFELDPKKDEDKKKIAGAQKVLSGQLQEIESLADQFSKILTTINKTLASMEKDIDSAS